MKLSMPTIHYIINCTSLMLYAFLVSLFLMACAWIQALQNCRKDWWKHFSFNYLLIIASLMFPYEIHWSPITAFWLKLMQICICPSIYATNSLLYFGDAIFVPRMFVDSIQYQFTYIWLDISSCWIGVL